MKHAPRESFDPEIARRLDAFLALLLQWNRRINLIAGADEGSVWHRHVLDSAQLAPLLPEKPGAFIDLGSGAGFPGLVLAVVAGWRVHLVESDARKAAFLREAVRVTGTDAVVHACRAESLSISPAPVVTARGIAPLPRLLELAVPLLAPGGICLFPKGRSAMDELTAAHREWHMRVERFPSRTSPTATLLRLCEIRRVQPTG
ncbi:MAG: 16S rRNA (guanine(527)-N(7))-methyltransferase RsmG [Rhodospirillales bacterium]|nr:16S rRNA (guanine(527)-N(7))-methyltransferase RsmG [Rhodospirillales bacterium]